MLIIILFLFVDRNHSAPAKKTRKIILVYNKDLIR